MHRIPLLLMLACLVGGCDTLQLDAAKSLPGLDWNKPDRPVIEIVALWEPAEGIGLDQAPTRGFAGQMMFFVAGDAEPVKVDGDVRIYVFDNQGTEEQRATPIHQFDFPAEVWNTYLRETNLGKTYQVFMPYTRKGGNAAECTLKVRFTPKQGLPLYSKMSSVFLAGRSPANAKAAAAKAQSAAATAAVTAPGTSEVDQEFELAMESAASKVQIDRLRMAAGKVIERDSDDEESGVVQAGYTEQDAGNDDIAAEPAKQYQLKSGN